MRKAAGLENFNLRTKDVPAVLDQLERWNKQADHALAGRLQLAQVGMSGHSFGAVTTQAVSGQSYPAVGSPLHRSADQSGAGVEPESPRGG